MVWGKIFWAERSEMLGDRRKSYLDELRGLYCPPNIIWATKWRLRLAGNVACMNEMRNAYVSLMGKHERKRPL